MQRKVKRIMLALVRVCMGGFVALNIVARNHADVMSNSVAKHDEAISPKRLVQLRKTNDMYVSYNPSFAAVQCPAFGNNQDAVDQGDYVVLLHGMGRTTWSMRKIEKELSRQGFRVVNVEYPSTREPIEILANQYLAKALATQCGQPGRKINFVTHSLGGIVLEFYLKNNTLPNIGRVVMLCPPGQGSELVDQWHNNILYRFLTGPAGQQLGTAPSSLPNKLGSVTFELGVIAGNRSMSMNPWTSRIIPGADDGKVSVTRAKVEGMQDFLVVPRTHTFIMRDRDVINQAIFFIKNGLFNQGERT